MKTVEEMYPDIDGFFWGTSDYHPLIASFEFTTLLWEEQGDYSGDSRILFYDDRIDEFGFLTFGWGSCSGCDALQACNSYEELTGLQRELFNKIQWFPTALEVEVYFATHDWQGDYDYNPDFNEHVILLARAITVIADGGIIEKGTEEMIKEWLHYKSK